MPKYYGEIYKTGTPLKEAVLAFLEDKKLHQALRWAAKRQTAYGAVATLKAIRTLRSPTIPESTKAGLAQGLGIDRTKLLTDEFYRKDPDRYRRAEQPPKRYPESHLKQMQVLLEKDIRSGKFVAIGYTHPRSPDDHPRRVPHDVISGGRIDFGSSTIVGNGLTYAVVRLVPATKFSASTVGLEARNTRSKKTEIEKAATPLIAAGHITPETPDKRTGTLVRKAADVKEGAKGFSDDTIMRHVKPLLPQTKSADGANPQKCNS